MRGPTLPPYFRCLLCLLGWGVEATLSTGLGGLLCLPISGAYSAYWGGGGGDATLSTGMSWGLLCPPILGGLVCLVGGGYSFYGGECSLLCPPIYGAYSAY